MRVVLYIALFLIILAAIGFGFFNMSMPEVSQTTISRTLDSKEAFPPQPTPAPASAVTAPESTRSAPVPNDDRE